MFSESMREYCFVLDLFQQLSIAVVSRVLSCIEEAFSADAIVVQCGADGLSGDPLGSGNLTEQGLGGCVSKILELNLPTLFLGGGNDTI